jgi:hypothetical protein
MEVLTFIYNSDRTTPAVDSVLEALADRGGAVDHIDTADADTKREAMLAVGNATRVGSKPAEIFDGDNNPEFSRGVLITEQATGRRELHIGDEMLEVL